MRTAATASATLVTLMLAAGAAGPLAAGKGARDLPGRYQDWLEDVSYIILDKERKEFLKIREDYQRDAFIRRFWEARDPDPKTPDNRFRSYYLARLEEARERYPSPNDDRRAAYVLNGDPTSIFETDCNWRLRQLQIWKYRYTEHVRGELLLILYRPGLSGPYRLWFPNTPARELFAIATDQSLGEILLEKCSLTREQVRDLMYDFQTYQRGGNLAVSRAISAPQLDPEWLTAFHTHSTEIDPDARRFEPRLSIAYPGPHKQRVIVRGDLRASRDDATVVELAGRRSYNFALTGEVLRDDELFESFKYVFDVPEDELTGDEVPMVFERWLRPGGYRMVLKLEDLHGGSAGRIEQEITVPALGGREGTSVADLSGPDARADEPTAPTSLQLVAEGKDLQRGYARFAARLEGAEPAKVRFFLEDRPILTKNRPPYSVELDLGSLPETMTVRAVALDTSGNELATDEVLLNPGDYGFAIRIVEPQWGSRHSGAVRARAAVETPEGGALDRVEFYCDDLQVATLFQDPFVTEIPLAHDDLVVIRAVAHLQDGNQTDDVAILNAADYLEQVDVRMIEVFASVLDARGLPLTDLDQDDFRILEDGAEQQILRFEHLENLPIYAGLLIDTSASMADSMEAVRGAAARFFERAIRPRDRASVVTFADRPRLVTGFTADLERLTGALAGIKAGEGTALYDSVLFALYKFRGLTGQRALLILSDGEDRRSQATFDEAREFALGSGVTLYTIGVERGMTRRGKTELRRLAEETGGRAFLIDSIAELDEIYDTVQQDLRSKYFLAYQALPSDDRAFRSIAVEVGRPDTEVRALRGYVPR